MSSNATRYWNVLLDAWRHRDQLGESQRYRQLREFLPAALEVQQNPPSTTARILGWALLVFTIIALLWATFGQVNIVATAEGKIIPSGQIKQIQPLEKGVIKTLYVEEGQFVKQGEPLIELEQTLTAADQNSIAQERLATELELVRLRTLQIWLQQDAKGELPSWPLAESSQLLLYQQQLEQSWLQYRAEQRLLQSTLQTRQAEWQQSQSVIQKLEQTLPLVTKRATALKTLLDKNVASEMDWLQLEEQRIQIVQDLAAEQSNAKKLQAAIREVEQQRNVQRAQAMAQNLAALTESQRRLSSLQEQFKKASDLNAKQILYAPVDGTVKQLAMNTIGGVVTEAQVLMEIVPKDETLIVEAWLPNKDIGFVSEGQEAEIKIHTFPFTKYGVIDAEVLSISTDAIADENLGLIYKMKLKMAKNTLWVDERQVSLIPGMAVTAEVQTGNRRIIEYVSAPLLRYKQESVRER